MATSSKQKKSSVFVDKFSTDEKEDIKLLYSKGKNLTEIGNKYNISYCTVRRFLSKEGITIIQNNIRSRKYTLNENYFENINTEEKAYFLGFLYADGSINFRTVSLSLQEKDKEILEKFRSLINSNKELYFINKDKSSNQYNLIFTSFKIVNDLKILGCIPNKTFKLEFPTEKQVPTYLIRHFIRGYFDGDGCISVNLNKNNKVKFSIVGRKDFLLNIQNILINNLGLNKTSLYKNGNVYYLEYTGIRQCSLIKSYMYNNVNIFLARKYEKFNLF